MIWPANALPSSCADHPEEVPIMLKRLVSTALVALVVLALLPAGGDAQAPGPIKIGVIQPLSGPVAASGNYVRMGAEIARDWINARGGVDGRKVELRIEDNKSDPKEAASGREADRPRPGPRDHGRVGQL